MCKAENTIKKNNFSEKGCTGMVLSNIAPNFSNTSLFKQSNFNKDPTKYLVLGLYKKILNSQFWLDMQMCNFEKIDLIRKLSRS